MNDQANTPMLPPPSGVSEWLSVWRDALTRPGEQTFARIAASPNAKLSTALIWVFLGSLVNLIFASLVQGAIFRQMTRNTDLGTVFPMRVGMGSLLGTICIGPFLSILGFVIFVGIVQVLAKMFGGRGTFEQLAYAIAAIVAPFSVVSGLLTLLSAIPYAGYCFGLLGFLVALYVIVLEVMAVKGVNQFGWGQALGSFFLPGIVLCCCLSFALFGIFRAIGTNMPGIFNSFPTPPPIP